MFFFHLDLFEVVGITFKKEAYILWTLLMCNIPKICYNVFCKPSDVSILKISLSLYIGTKFDSPI